MLDICLELCYLNQKTSTHFQKTFEMIHRDWRRSKVEDALFVTFHWDDWILIELIPFQYL